MDHHLKPWRKQEKFLWLEEQVFQRSYFDDVVTKIDKLRDRFEVIKYGELSYSVKNYPLFLLRTLEFDSSKKNILITGGVHGYETSGVHGALQFLKDEAEKYSNEFNIIVAPCISPWGYETINRWNPDTIDPNRSFFKDGPSQECNFIMKAIEEMDIQVFAHIDLHETTDTDNTIFRPALEQRDAVEQEVWDIPDGFYLVGDTENPSPEFQKAIIDSVQKVTHIAEADISGKLIGEDITQNGVINYPLKKLNLCAGFSNSTYSSTTEVYPDSERVTDLDCISAQVAAILGGLKHLLSTQR